MGGAAGGRGGNAGAGAGAGASEGSESAGGNPAVGCAITGTAANIAAANTLVDHPTGFIESRA